MKKYIYDILSFYFNTPTNKVYIIKKLRILTLQFQTRMLEHFHYTYKTNLDRQPKICVLRLYKRAPVPNFHDTVWSERELILYSSNFVMKTHVSSKIPEYHPIVLYTAPFYENELNWGSQLVGSYFEDPNQIIIPKRNLLDFIIGRALPCSPGQHFKSGSQHTDGHLNNLVTLYGYRQTYKAIVKNLNFIFLICYRSWLIIIIKAFIIFLTRIGLSKLTWVVYWPNGVVF